MDLRQILVPDVYVGMLEIKALHFTGHISCANHRQRAAIELEVVVVDAEARTGEEIRSVANPESRMVDRTNPIAFQQLGFDDIESLAFGGGQDDGSIQRSSWSSCRAVRWRCFRNRR